MYVLEIIPFSRTAPTTALSYRSSTKHPVGTLLMVPLRRKQVVGLVVGNASVQDSKAELKAANFMLHAALGKIVGKMSPALLTAAKETARYHAASLGAVLSALLVPVLPEEAELGEILKMTSARSKLSTSEIIPLEKPFLERAKVYKEIISNAKDPVLFIVPTQAEIEEWAALLAEFKPLSISGKLSGKRREEALLKALTASPRLLITTPAFAWLPLQKSSHIVLERVSAGTYSLPKRPYIDMRFAAAAFAHARNVPVTFGDYPLPLEYRDKRESALSFPSENMRVIDTRKKKEAVAKTAPWQAVPDTLRTQIAHVLADTTERKSGKIVLLSVRRGYAPTVVCGDCGTTLTDELGRTLSLATSSLSKGSKRIFRTNDGKAVSAEHVFCKNCGSWNLVPLGIGIERVEEELRAAFPKAAILRIDQDSQKKASLKKIRAQIAEADIILGTEFMLPYLSAVEKVQLGIIVSADSLLALPFWRARERFVRICLMLSERAEAVLVATRHPEDAALQSGFWKEEAGLRSMLKYPPFGTLLVFHMEGSAERIIQYRAAIREACLPFVPFEIPERPLPSSGTSPRFHASSVLQLAKDQWPNEDLVRNISRLSPAIRHSINSENLW